MSHWQWMARATGAIPIIDRNSIAVQRDPTIPAALQRVKELIGEMMFAKARFSTATFMEVTTFIQDNRELWNSNPLLQDMRLALASTPPGTAIELVTLVESFYWQSFGPARMSNDVVAVGRVMPVQVLASDDSATDDFYCKKSWGFCWTQPGCVTLGSDRPGFHGECWGLLGKCECILVSNWSSALLMAGIMLLIAALAALVGAALIGWLLGLLAKFTVEALTAGIAAAIAIMANGGSEEEAKAAIQKATGGGA